MTDEVLCTFTTDELRLLGAAVASIDVDETVGEAMHLTLQPGGRTWVMEGLRGQLVLDVQDPHCTRHLGPLAISERVRRFADCFDREPATLSLVDDRTVVAASGSTTAAIDLVVGREGPPAEWEFARVAGCTVEADTFLGVLWSARCMPSGLGEREYPMPPMWMQLGDGTVVLHVDWTDFVDGRSTYRMVAEHADGNATVAIPHALLENFLRGALAVEVDDPPLTIEVGQVIDGDSTREALRFRSGDWKFLVWAVDPLLDRWGGRVLEALLEGGIDLEDMEDHEWVVRHEGRPARVRLHHRSPDVARVSAVVVSGVGESLDLLRELGSLNAAAAGLRYWLEDDTVHVAADVPCTALNTLAPAVREVARSAAELAPMLAALTSPAPPKPRRRAR